MQKFLPHHALHPNQFFNFVAGQHAVIVGIRVIPEGSLDVDIQGKAVLVLVHIDFLHQQPQVCFRQIPIREDIVNKKEIAKILRIGLPLVKYRIKRAKELLASYLGKEEMP